MSANTDCISAIADILSATGVIAGFWFANRQLNNWRNEGVGRKRAEVAEQAIIAAQNASDSLQYLRARFRQLSGVTPSMSKEDRERISIEDHEKRLQVVRDSFRELNAASVRVDAIIADDQVSKAIDGLFDARRQTEFALQETYLLDNNVSSERELLVRYRAIAFGSYDEDDELGKRQISCLNVIKRRLQPPARMEDSRKRKLLDRSPQ